MKLKKIEEYEINSCTMFLQPIDYGSKVYTNVFEIDDEFISPFKPLDIVKKSCDYFGCDYESRKKGTRQLIGYSRKIPIAIEPTNHLFFSLPHHRTVLSVFGFLTIMLSIITVLLPSKH